MVQQLFLAAYRVAALFHTLIENTPDVFSFYGRLPGIHHKHNLHTDDTTHLRALQQSVEERDSSAAGSIHLI